jgi:uncharacterized lipoprotein YmbA
MLAMMASLCGCRSAEPDYYVMQPRAGSADAAIARNIEIRRPGLAGFLDRADIVVDTGAFRLKLGSNARWGEPLGEMTERVLVEDLAQRLPASQVFGAGGAIGVDADLRIDLDIQQFGGQDDRMIVLTGEVIVERRHDHVVLRGRHVTLSVPAEGASAASLAAGMSTLLGMLADQIESDLRGLPLDVGSNG